MPVFFHLPSASSDTLYGFHRSSYQRSQITENLQKQEIKLPESTTKHRNLFPLHISNWQTPVLADSVWKQLSDRLDGLDPPILYALSSFKLLKWKERGYSSCFLVYGVEALGLMTLCALGLHLRMRTPRRTRPLLQFLQTKDKVSRCCQPPRSHQLRRPQLLIPALPKTVFWTQYHCPQRQAHLLRVWENKLSHPQRRQKKGCWSYKLLPSRQNLPSTSVLKQSHLFFPTPPWNFFRALPERRMKEAFLQTQLEAWEIDHHEKRISAEVTALAAKEPANKNQVLKQPEESKKILFFPPFLMIWFIRLQASS